MDVSARTTSIYIMSASGKVILEGKVESYPESKDSLRLRRKVAAWDDGFLATLISA